MYQLGLYPDRAGGTVRAASEDGTGEPPGAPLENPAIESIPHDPLLEPHPSEPGVKGDGGAFAPLENPGARPLAFLS